jgi:hypothetical protein
MRLHASAAAKRPAHVSAAHIAQSDRYALPSSHRTPRPPTEVIRSPHVACEAAPDERPTALLQHLDQTEAVQANFTRSNSRAIRLHSEGVHAGRRSASKCARHSQARCGVGRERERCEFACAEFNVIVLCLGVCRAAKDILMPVRVLQHNPCVILPSRPPVALLKGVLHVRPELVHDMNSYW